MFLMGVISPGLSLILFFKNISQRRVRSFFVLLFALFGYTMLLSGDALTHYERFEAFKEGLNLDGFFLTLIKTFTFSSGPSDTFAEPYLFLVSSTIAFLGLDGRYIFLITSAVFGYFFVNCLAVVLQRIKGDGSKLFWLVIILFLSWKAFNGVISVRNWTAAYILFYGFLRYYEQKKIKYLLLIALTPFIHFAYIFISLLAILAFFGPNLRWFYGVLLTMSFIPIGSVISISEVSLSNELLNAKAQAYAADDNEIEMYKERRELLQENYSLHKKYYRNLAFLGVSIVLGAFAFWFLVKPDYWTYFRRIGVLGFFKSSIVLFSISNFVYEIIPVLGWRLLVNSGLYLFAFLLLFMYNRFFEISVSRLLKFTISIGLVFLLNNLYFELSLTFKSLDLKYFVSPILYPFVHDEALPIKELLKKLFGLT